MHSEIEPYDILSTTGVDFECFPFDWASLACRVNCNWSNPQSKESTTGPVVPADLVPIYKPTTASTTEISRTTVSTTIKCSDGWFVHGCILPLKNGSPSWEQCLTHTRHIACIGAIQCAECGII